MIIKRKVFSIIRDENGEEKIFSTTEFINEEEYLERKFSAKGEAVKALRAAKKANKTAFENTKGLNYWRSLSPREKGDGIIDAKGIKQLGRHTNRFENSTNPLHKSINYKNQALGSDASKFRDNAVKNYMQPGTQAEWDHGMSDIDTAKNLMKLARK